MHSIIFLRNLSGFRRATSTSSSWGVGKSIEEAQMIYQLIVELLECDEAENSLDCMRAKPLSNVLKAQRQVLENEELRLYNAGIPAKPNHLPVLDGNLLKYTIPEGKEFRQANFFNYI